MRLTKSLQRNIKQNLKRPEATPEKTNYHNQTKQPETGKPEQPSQAEPKYQTMLKAPTKTKKLKTTTEPNASGKQNT
jgi:hypothetical protein